MKNVLSTILALALTTTIWAQCNADAQNLVDTAREAGNFQTLLAAVEAAGLADALVGKEALTVFAPTDEAFAALPEGTVQALLNDIPTLTAILTYHVVPGTVDAAHVVESSWLETLQGQAIRVQVTDSGVLVDGASVVATDVFATNGVIHVIDQVILPREDIVATASAAGTFQTLLTAAKAAGLAETLSHEGPFTIFAPNDQAFAALTPGTVDALLNDIPTLKAILTYHVVPGRVLSTELGTELESLNGTIGVTVSDAGVHVGGARIVAADVIAGNGVIHVIDQVLIPEPSK